MAGPRARDRLIGKTLGGYQIESSLGRGATARVYRGVHPQKGGAAIKVVRPDLSSSTALEKRYRREARLLDKLSHPNIVRIHDFGTDEGRTFIAMELLEGQTLEEKLTKGPLTPVREALRIYEPVLSAVGAAHEMGIVHRDLKPANVFVTDEGKIKVLDFGLAKMLSSEELDNPPEDDAVTRQGHIVGTPAYMAPEQITGLFLDVRADVYALGVMLFELLADRRPFLDTDRGDLLRAHLLDPVPAAESVRAGLRVHASLSRLLQKAMAKEPDDRYGDAKEMRKALVALPKNAASLAGEGRRTRKRKTSHAEVISRTEQRTISESTRAGPALNKSKVRRGEPPKWFLAFALLISAALMAWFMWELAG